MLKLAFYNSTMPLGITLYASVGAIWLGWRLLYGPRPTFIFITVAVAAVLVFLALALAVFPRTVCSFWARVQHAPEDALWYVLNARPFNHDFVEPGVVLGRMPRTMEDVLLIKDLYDLSAMVIMSEPWELYLSVDSVRQVAQLDVLWLPTPDFTAPSLEDIERGVEFLTAVRAR